MKRSRAPAKNFLARRVFFLIRVFLLACAVLFVFGFGVFVYYAKDLPRPERFGEIRLALPTRIYDRTGQVLLYEIYGEEKRDIISLGQVSPFLKDAVIATEDANFYSHFGLDVRGMGRAILTNLKLRAPAQGGSTISQQLIRTSLLSRKKTLERKVQEIVLTLELERRYSKDEILGFYLNQIPFGSNAYGVASASKTYFGKNALDLSLAEAATLAGMIQAPSYYSPYGSHLDELMKRKGYVLSRMVSIGSIPQEDANRANAEILVFADPSPTIKAPHFSLYIVDLLVQEYGEEFLREHGLTVITSLDWELQQLAEKAVLDRSATNASHNAHNAALVGIDPKTGEILAMVGSRNWFATPYPEGCAPGVSCLFDPKVNVATRAPGRQPGSAFKPFAYVTAFMKGYDDQIIVQDELTNFGVWGGKEYIPQNYDGRFRGPVTLREALAQSLNIPSIKVLLDFAGIQDSINTARDMGLATIKEDASNYGPSLVLGGGEVKLLELASAYGVFAAEGVRVPYLPILRIEDSEKTIVKEQKNAPIRILPQDDARLITDILSDNEARTPIFGGSSSLVVPGFQVAVKTGTTQEYRDAWAVGYTPALSAGVWVGNSNNDPIRQSGVMVAAPIWNQFMRNALPLLESR